MLGTAVVPVTGGLALQCLMCRHLVTSTGLKTCCVEQVALVGAPNVGKSSLVNVLSSGVPEVCDYPFTTRSVKMGHFFIDGHRHQVRACSLSIARIACSAQLHSQFAYLLAHAASLWISLDAMGITI